MNNQEQKIINKCQKYNLSNEQIAYILATYRHETNRGVWLEELASGDDYEWRTDLGNTQLGDGRRFKGRGFVQLTGRNNYQYWSNRLGIDLINNPDLAKDEDYASEILVLGMIEGRFTGAKLADYVGNGQIDYYSARQVVNWLDKAELVAQYAWQYLNELNNIKDIINYNEMETIIVQQGEGLSQIAKRAGYADFAKTERWQAITDLNGGGSWISFNKGLYEGQVIRVKPATESSAVIAQSTINNLEALVADLKGQLNSQIAKNAQLVTDLEILKSDYEQCQQIDKRTAEGVLSDFVKSLFSRKFLLTVVTIISTFISSNQGLISSEQANILILVQGAIYNVLNVLEKNAQTNNIQR